MNLLDELFLEAKMTEASFERDREVLRRRAEALVEKRELGPRALVGGWLVRAGLWLDPRAQERTRVLSESGKAGQQA